jgi:hypothetical protein
MFTMDRLSEAVCSAVVVAFEQEGIAFTRAPTLRGGTEFRADEFSVLVIPQPPDHILIRVMEGFEITYEVQASFD